MPPRAEVFIRGERINVRGARVPQFTTATIQLEDFNFFEILNEIIEAGGGTLTR
jgi:hypothetical protein